MNEEKSKLRERVWVTFGVPFREALNEDPWMTALVKQKFDSVNQAMCWIVEMQLDILEKKHKLPGYGGYLVNERFHNLISEASRYTGRWRLGKHDHRDKPIPVKIEVFKFTNDNKHRLVSHDTYNLQRGESPP